MVTQRLHTGTVVWADFGSTVGREQSGQRPAIVISSEDFVDVADRLAIVVPCSRAARGWPNHVEVRGDTGLSSRTFAMTEQPRTVSPERVLRVLGRVDPDCLNEVMRWVHTWLHPAA
jgi:mRNA interferase MazF